MTLRDAESGPTTDPLPKTAATKTATNKSSSIRWDSILEEAATIVYSYDTGVTLRQLFYRLVAAELIPNNQNAYKGLSRTSAIARREGWFPPLIDRTRTIHEPLTFMDTSQALDWLTERYRLDRTEGQPYAVYLGVEKSGLVEQLRSWFVPLGVPILPLGGYSSQSYVDEVIEHLAEQDRPSVLLYAGDFDPSGEDIDRDFRERVGGFDDYERVALNADQVDEYQLPPQPGKASDSRAAGFVARHGRLVQVEMDALDPTVLRQLYSTAINEYWDWDAYQERLALEAEQVAELEQIGELL